MMSCCIKALPVTANMKLAQETDHIVRRKAKHEKRACLPPVQINTRPQVEQMFKIATVAILSDTIKVLFHDRR
jgi:hypothetical protein